MKSIPIKKKHLPLAVMTNVYDKLETFDGAKLGVPLLLVGTGLMFLSSDTAQYLAIRLGNSAYNKFRDLYSISDEEFIHVGWKAIEVLDKE